METSKLYSEIEKVIYEKTPSLPYNSAYQVRDAAKSIEQLLLDKMEDFINWANKSWYYDDEVDKWVRYGQVSHSTKELIQIYLNK